MYEIIVKELWKDWKLLNQELIDCVDWRSQDADTMCLNRMKNLVDWDSFDLLRIFCDLNEHISMEIVVIGCHVFLKVSQKE